MKKKLLFILTAVLLLSLIAGCDIGATVVKTENGDLDLSSLEPVELTMATGGTSGTYYGFATAVAQVIHSRLGNIMEITVESTGASGANIQMLDSGAAQLAIVQNDVMSYAYEAKDMFNGDAPVTSFAVVAACYPEQCQIIAEPSITSIEELRGKRISVGDAGSGVEFNARHILSVYGISFEDITVINESFAKSADSLKSGEIDAVFMTSGAPTTAVTELARSYTFNILGLDSEHIKVLRDSYGFYTPVIIPGGLYDGVSADVQTVAVMATIVAHSDVSSEIIYEFVKGLFEYKSDITAGHAKGELLDPVSGVSGVSIPLHAGAERYYKEIGVK